MGAGPTVEPGAGRGGLEGGDALGEERADHTAEDVARARRGQSRITCGDDADLAPRSATTVVLPFRSTTAPVAAASSRAAARRSAGGGVAGESLELPVVGREHRRLGPAGQDARGVGPEQRERVAVKEDGPVGGDQHRGGSVAPVAAAVPRPGPMTSAPKRAGEHPAGAVPAGSASPIASVGRRASSSAPGQPTCTMPAPARSAAAVARWPAPASPGDPATRSTAAFHLWDSLGRAGIQAATSSRDEACRR